MTRFARVPGLLAIVFMVSMLIGCAPGNPGGALRNLSALASGQVAAALYVQQWGQILWGLVTSQTGAGTPSYGEPTFHEDGSFSQQVTTADGTTFVMTVMADGSGRIDITWPDRSTQTVEQSAAVFDGTSLTSIDWKITASSGMVVDYASIVDDRGTIFDMSDDTTRLQGTAALPGGLTQTFTVETAAGATTVHAAQSDGSTFTLAVPLLGPDYLYPDFSRPATGAYRRRDLDLAFTLTGAGAPPVRWTQMATDFHAQDTGDFALNADFSGAGQLSRAMALQAFTSWSPAGAIQLRLTSAEQSATAPAGASVDYLLHRWQTMTALLAPAPGLRGRRPSALPLTSRRD